MSSSIREWKPEGLWKHFDEISKIPRGSKNETAVGDYVMDVARDAGLEADRDHAGNIVVRKPASAGLEGAPVTVLQGHLDMVNEKNSDVEHDFDRDPLELVQDGGYLKAKGTTLGSDNGIGVAASLAIAEDKGLIHGPLELLFTVDEETGLTGAFALEPDFIKGRCMLNLDTEEEGSVYVGCAGGADSTITLKIARTDATQDTAALAVKILGLKGGHSGVDIHEQRGNAIVSMARALWSVSQTVDFRLVSIRGGSKRNAIPREIEAVVNLAKGHVEAFRSAFDEAMEPIKAKFMPIDPDLAGRVERAGDESPAEPMDERSNRRLLDLLASLPHGVVSMSYDIPDLVETSTNLAVVDTAAGAVTISMNSRSSVASALRSIRNRITAIASLAGATVEEKGEYPGWKPDLESRALAVVKKTYAELFGDEPGVKAIHAGLECGIIGEKYPGMDMVSFGPQIENPHSPDERVHVGSVARFYDLAVAVIRGLAKG